ncbi:hypothetical protein NDU88_009571, partial [Pleurodeles waltl]
SGGPRHQILGCDHRGAKAPTHSNGCHAPPPGSSSLARGCNVQQASMGGRGSLPEPSCISPKWRMRCSAQCDSMNKPVQGEVKNNQGIPYSPNIQVP